MLKLGDFEISTSSNQSKIKWNQESLSIVYCLQKSITDILIIIIQIIKYF